ncbi:hypothetical protein BC936DRAFT_139082, partial [Jimgerdemannia flammicorona]
MHMINQICLANLIRITSQYRHQIAFLELQAIYLQRQENVIQQEVKQLIEPHLQQIDTLQRHIELGVKHAKDVEKIQAAHTTGLKMLRETAESNLSNRQTAEIEEQRVKGTVNGANFDTVCANSSLSLSSNLPHTSGSGWRMLEERQQWIMYDPDQNIIIENAYNNWCSPVSVSDSIPVVTVVGGNYEIMFSKVGHFQRNTKTNYKRYIMRKENTQVMSNNDKV